MMQQFQNFVKNGDLCFANFSKEVHGALFDGIYKNNCIFYGETGTNKALFKQYFEKKINIGLIIFFVKTAGNGPKTKRQKHRVHILGNFTQKA